ncbi:phosphoribosylformylglycinamidine synthase subunit PurL [Rhodothermus marinus]|uniref:phosphoribosylformylglycinamidine synthase subunit PurL n=1 Tax=Rhodothermus marinus TaxID=29549 RepID=UPI0012BA4EBF|nr:phosphoribosylformylglycinamidine synthase subunit PurL [Rhodothermus marinus]BBM68333.1 phosphoribosylformylglycinamidine synthase subunit PurL [Rhodothermus marinus]BBM71302.1 phosphoribosylformylglycinamidine synthase subunit PurL [Rhodothermus marinus]
MAETLLHEPEVTLELARQHGLTDEEYGWIVEKLGRTPTFTELGIYSVMWSEHCSYKNSIAVLKTLPREGPALLVGAGEENAGLVDIGDGLAVAFKIESHNHPSAVEPYQGAATGVGGIHRDIFTMGARPICALNSLRFGRLDNPRVRYLLDGVVRGIADYGNAFGVPTVAGEVYFDPSYEGNPLVNAMSVGIVRVGQTVSAAARGKGNLVYIVGSATGRDGIHGATFASEEITEESEAKRPSVQVGDPFTEKLLLEATLEAIRKGLIVGMQDMGAAGLTCSSCEMSARGKSGMVLYLERVPVREPDMTPYEIMLSESQERMLVVCEPEKAAELEEVFRKWDLHAACIGEVTDDGRVRVYWHGQLVADVEAEHLVLGGGAPVYYREARRPAYLDETLAFDPATLPDVTPETAGDVLLQLLGSPNIASKRWVFEQYDTMVRTNTVVGPGPSDAAVIRIKGTRKALAVKVDGNGRYVYLNPRRGGQIAVCEAARNVVCAGGRPVAITNCLNFGNPYKPEVYWTFKEAVAGIGDACRALETPVTGGNVSFYNENPQGAIFPTPTIGMLGVLEDVTRATTADFKQAGDHIYLLTPAAWLHRNDLGGSEYLAYVHGITAGDAPHLDLEEEKAVQQALLALIEAGLVRSAHDVADGGLAVCLAECVIFSPGLGARVELPGAPEVRLDALLFGEAQSRIVFTVAPEHEAEVARLLEGRPVQARRIGTVTDAEHLELLVDGQPILNLERAQLVAPYETAIPSRMPTV